VNIAGCSSLVVEDRSVSVSSVAAVRAVCVAGARPNFVKIKPVIDALEARGADTVLVHTGQHYDADMSDVFFTDIGLRQPDLSLGVGSGNHAEQTARVMIAFEPVLEGIAPDVVVVVGDVNSTMACSLVAAKTRARVAHVEAGLRSWDWTMPEEINRVVTDSVSDALLAPSSDAVDNLRAEGHPDDQIHLVGNVMIDTLLSNLDRARCRPILTTLGLSPGEYGLVTLHRPSNVDDPVVLAQLMDALATIAALCPIVFPVHPRTKSMLADARVAEGIILTGPAGYLDFVALEAAARLVLTDSGGVQEETTVLGIPCLTLRDNTERPITVTEGTNTVVGRDPERIVTEAIRALHLDVTRRCPPLWDGRAGERTAEVLLQVCSEGMRGPSHRR
jgi:UDP-N-acetylglucosamine 2-epimerase (non-hydrolysing)